MANMSNSVTSLKLSFNGEIRRLSVMSEGLTYQELMVKTQSVFPHLKSLQFSWVDDENDKVIISSDEELSEALRIMANENKGYLRFEVLAKTTVTFPTDESTVIEEKKTNINFQHSMGKLSSESQPESSPFGTITHVGVVCDHCGEAPLRGARFKCAVRDDFDLCEACEGQRRQHPYPMVKIYHPDQMPIGITVVLEEDGRRSHCQMKQQACGGKFNTGRGACHVGVTCDGCESRNFSGPRFKCTERYDYDLCSTCESKDEHAYPMLKIYPKHARVGIQIFCDSDSQMFQSNPAGPSSGLFGMLKATGLFKGRMPAHCRHHHHGYGHGHKGRPKEGPGVGAGAHPNGRQCHPNSHHPHQQQCPRNKKEACATVSPACGCRKGYDQHFWHQSKVAQAAADRAKHREVMMEQKRQHKLKEDARLEDELLEMCIQESMADTVKDTDNLPPTPKAKLMARFIQDVTMPDGSQIAPCSTFFKTWRVRNDGETDWPAGCHIVSAGGDLLADPKLGKDYLIREPIPAATSGEEVELTLELYAPNVTGRHVGYFRLQTPEGNYFGQRLWSDIRVNDSDLTLSMTLSPWQVIDSVPDKEAVSGTDLIITEQQEEQEEKEIVANATAEVIGSQVTYAENALEEAVVEEYSSLYEQELDQELIKWAHELQVLSAMGFHDLEQLLPVLKTHIAEPVSVRGVALDGVPPVEEGLQAVVLELLSED